MQPRGSRTSVAARRRSPGFSLFELTVCIALIGVFAGVLLDRLLYYEEAAEKAVVELQASTLKVALQVHVGDLISRNQKLDYAVIARENPMRWLEHPLVGYRGEFSTDAAAQLPKGSWYFDRSTAELVYLVKLDRNFRPRVGRRGARALARKAGTARRCVHEGQHGSRIAVRPGGAVPLVLEAGASVERFREGVVDAIVRGEQDADQDRWLHADRAGRGDHHTRDPGRGCHPEVRCAADRRAHRQDERRARRR